MRADVANGLVILAVAFAAVVYTLIGVRTIGPAPDQPGVRCGVAAIVFAGLMLRLLRAAEDRG